MPRLTKLAVAIAAAALALILGPAAVALANPDYLKVSRNGTAFAAATPRNLSLDLRYLVPGQQVGQDFWFRNDSPEPAVLRAGFTVTQLAPELRDHLTVGVGAPGADSVRTYPTPREGKCAFLMPPRRLAPGEVVGVRIAADLAGAAGNDTRTKTARLGLRVGLSQDVGTQPEPGCEPVGGQHPSPEPTGPDPQPSPGPGGTGPGGTGPGESGAGTGSGAGSAGSRLIDTVRELADSGAAAGLGWLLAAVAAIIAGAGLVTTGSKQKGSDQ